MNTTTYDISDVQVVNIALDYVREIILVDK